MVSAACTANADSFIDLLEKKYDTIIGERGAKLSGGEKQRLSIARSVYQNPKILILDEATSSLDSESEIKVQKAIDNLVNNRTVIIIAHRLSTIKNADRIFVFDDGEIKLKGQYLYNTQSYGDVLRRPNSYRDRTGEWITYNPHGGIESTEDWSDIEKEKRIKALHNKHNNKRINSNPDKNDGPYSITQKGVIVEEGSYFSKMQDGIIKRYNKNGSIIEMSFYRDGRRDSVQTTYGWDNQIIMKEEWYKDGLKHGKSFKYNDYIKRDTGNKETYLWSVRDYSNGNLDGKAPYMRYQYENNK